jgi:hypothetical protein
LESTLILKLGRLTGNAVAISNTLALTALHSKGKVGDKVLIRTRRGVELPGKVIFHSFIPDMVDISVVQLSSFSTSSSSSSSTSSFSEFLSVIFGSLKRAEKIYVIGYSVGAADESMEVVHPCYVNAIENGTDSAMIQSDYTSFDGLSGAGVVTKVVGGVCKVVGVHVASHDRTVQHPPVKKARHSSAASVQSVNLACETLASNIHGHHAYCLICEVSRVPDLVQFLHDNGLN